MMPYFFTAASMAKPCFWQALERVVWPMDLSMVAMRLSSTASIAFPGMKNCKIVASSEGRNAERTRLVFDARGLPIPARLSVSVWGSC